MRETITSIAMLLTVQLASAQITITAVDMPIQSTTTNLAIIPAGSLTVPSKGANQNWNYGSATPIRTAANNYMLETDPIFTSEGIDVYLDDVKLLNANLGYEIASEIDFNSSGVDEKGLYVYEQAYELSAFTGSPLDSLKFPEQKIILSNTKKVIKFPFTMGDTWQTTSRRSIDFTISAAAFGLSNTPAKHVYYVTRTDSVIGYGKLRVYAGSVPSVPIDVLMNKTTQIAKDSFYLAGAPAPPALLNAFSVTQNQQLESQYNYNFYRKGHYNYLMRVKNSDVNFSQIIEAVLNTDNITPTNITEASLTNFSTILFPNPCANSSINMVISGGNFKDATYSIFDITGKIVAQNLLNMQNNSCTISLASDLPNGIYNLVILSNDSGSTITETFLIER